MSDSDEIPDWKLKLRYGQITTDLQHLTALAEGRMVKPDNDFACPVGPAWMAMKTWAADTDESADMIRVIGNQIGFEVTGKVEIFATEPERPPTEKPTGYDINFTPFGDDDANAEGTEQDESLKP
ncbi:MAG: hypothetical protein MI807_10415 [Verrucomicrobiales bacterium]|nr:hypothetical protein [Verrucomicrobiales bacterium]